MDERAIKRLVVMVATAIVIILVLKHVGLRMATTANLAHQKQAVAHKTQAPAEAGQPQVAPPQTAQPQSGDEGDSLNAPSVDGAAAASSAAAPAMPQAARPMPEPASAPASLATPPAAADPTLSAPPASFNAN